MGLLELAFGRRAALNPAARESRAQEMHRDERGVLERWELIRGERDDAVRPPAPLPNAGIASRTRNISGTEAIPRISLNIKESSSSGVCSGLCH